MSSETRHVRIKPSNKRESHSAYGVTIKKGDGWVRVPIGIAARLAQEPMSEQIPGGSAKVFDVCTEAEARAIDKTERKVTAPAGTVAKPRLVGPSGSAEAESDEPDLDDLDEEEVLAPRAAPQATKRGGKRRG